MKKGLSLFLVMALMLSICTCAMAATPIEWLTTGDAAAKAIEPGDRIIQAIDEKLDIDLDVQYVPEGNVEKVNVAMASGDFPDIVTGTYGDAATLSWINYGMVIPLNDYLDEFPNIKAWLADYEWTAIDGKYYGIPFIEQYHAANTLLIMRGDWLEKLGLAYPKTLDEMAEVLKAFTFNDPDGDGQNNTYGFSGTKYTGTNPLTNFKWVFYAYGRQYSDYELNADNEVIPWFESDCFIPGMRYIKALYDLGVIDPEFVLNDQSRMEEKFYQSKAGCIPAYMYRHVARHTSSLTSINPDASIAYGLPPVGPDGESFGLNDAGRTGKMTCITSACKDPRKALAFIDLMLSKEGNDLIRLGIEGIHYTKDGDSIVFNEEERAKDAFSPDGWAHALAWGSFYWPIDSGYVPVSDAFHDKAIETMQLATEAQHPALVKQMTTAEIELGGMLNDILEQYFIDMLYGKLDIEDGAAKLSAEWRAQGGDALLAELNEALKGE